MSTLDRFWFLFAALDDRFWFLFAAYGAFWTLLALFLMRLGRRHRELERELRALEARLPHRPAT